jgi:hypothetical protein
LISKERREFVSVVGVLVDSKFEILRELFIELLPVFVIFGDFLNELKTLLDHVSLDDLKNLVFLKRLSGDVQRKIFRVDNSFDETEIVRDDVFAIVHDEDSLDIEFDV